jgi:hypothetical protein
LSIRIEGDEVYPKSICVGSSTIWPLRPRHSANVASTRVIHRKGDLAAASGGGGGLDAVAAP